MFEKVGGSVGYLGGAFDDGAYTGVRKVSITYSLSGISHIMVDYDKVGKIITVQNGDMKGENKVQRQQHEFVLDYPDEYITSVEGTCDLVSGLTNRVSSLSFKTSKERRSPTYGKMGKQTFVLESKGRALVGFHGRAGLAIDAIGAYFGPSPAEKLHGKGGDGENSGDDGEVVRKIYMEQGLDPIKLEYQGGSGGNYWDHGPYPGVRKVYVTYSPSGISHIMIDYDIIGKVITVQNGDMIGENRAQGQQHEFVLDYPVEYITSVEGTCDLVSGLHNRVRSLIFKTSKERTSPTYGKVGEKNFVLESKGRALVGFHGRAGWAIDAIGAYFGTPPVEKLKGKGGDGGASWDDGAFDGVRKIYVGHGPNGIASVKFVYEKNNQVVLGEDHGKSTMLGYEEFELDYPNEYITAVEGCYDKIFGSESTVITMLKFKTNVRTSPPFGLESTSSFVLEKEGHKIVGFHGKSSYELHQFGVSVALLGFEFLSKASRERVKAPSYTDHLALRGYQLQRENAMETLHLLRLLRIKFRDIYKLTLIFKYETRVKRSRALALLEKLNVSLLAGIDELTTFYADQRVYDDVEEVKRWFTKFEAAFSEIVNVFDKCKLKETFRRHYLSSLLRLFPSAIINGKFCNELQEKIDVVVALVEYLVDKLRFTNLKTMPPQDRDGIVFERCNAQIDYELRNFSSSLKRLYSPPLSKNKELHGETTALYSPEPESSSDICIDATGIASKPYQRQLSYNLTTLSSDAGTTSGKVMPQQDQDEMGSESSKVKKVPELTKPSASLKRLHIEGCPELIFLPESLMQDCPNLQELLVVDCHSLETLPGRYPSTTLKTLYIRDCMKLKFIESQQKMLIFPQLEDLFIGRSCSTLCSFPLALFPKLKSLSIRHCEQFSSFTATRGKDRLALEALEITDCPNLELFPEEGLKTLKLASLLISNCRILKELPADLSTLTSLLSFHINECPEVKGIPSCGFPKSLQTLCISRCQNLIPIVQWGLFRLGNLHDFEIEGGNADIESFPDKGLLPQSLYSLRISGFKNLRTLDYEGLEDLPTLEMLEISGCDELESLPDEDLPSSLSLLRINDCSTLKENIISNDFEWFKIKHIQLVEIDGEELLRGRKKTEYVLPSLRTQLKLKEIEEETSKPDLAEQAERREQYFMIEITKI